MIRRAALWRSRFIAVTPMGPSQPLLVVPRKRPRTTTVPAHHMPQPQQLPARGVATDVPTASMEGKVTMPMMLHAPHSPTATAAQFNHDSTRAFSRRPFVRLMFGGTKLRTYRASVAEAADVPTRSPSRLSTATEPLYRIVGASGIESSSAATDARGVETDSLTGGVEMDSGGRRGIFLNFLRRLPTGSLDERSSSTNDGGRPVPRLSFSPLLPPLPSFGLYAHTNDDDVTTMAATERPINVNAGAAFESHRPPPAYFVGNLSGVWLDDDTNYCSLCREPAQSRSSHIGFERDHHAINFMFYFSVHFPIRMWSAARLHHDAKIRFPKLYRHVTSHEFQTKDDVSRRAQLRAIIETLAKPPYRAVWRALSDALPPGLTGQGEKMLRESFARVTWPGAPHAGPNVMAAFSQKAWGRSNCELLYDLLNLGSMQESLFQTKAKTNKSDKSAVIRQLAVELHLLSTRQEVGQWSVESSNGDGESQQPVTTTSDSNSRPSVGVLSEVCLHLADLALHRLCAEMVYLKSADYNVRAQRVIESLAYPTPAELNACGFH